MSPTKLREEKSVVDDLQSALEAETELRFELEERCRRMRQEFEEFILVAAHDMKEPLRSVTAYSELLARTDAERSDADADQFRRYILDGTGRIQALVAGMVDYVGAATDSRYLLSVDMNEVFREASLSVVSPSGRRPAVITRDPLPVVRGDLEKLVKVARHLLDNAARYCETAEPVIHISARMEDAEWLFTVRDNGPGIDAAYHQRIFEPFKRLHGRQYAGCGLGLTFCRRAIESHGGSIWVESRPGEGATFRFALPASD